MIVGSGAIAKAFSKLNLDALIFASGVSNSACTDPAEFEREAHLLEQHIGTTQQLVYFSSMAQLNVNTPYFNHKLACEAIARRANRHLILQLPQIVSSGGHSNNLFNLLRSKLVNQQVIRIWKGAIRSLIDVDDLVVLTQECLQRTERATLQVMGPDPQPIQNIVGWMAEALEVIPRLEVLNLDSGYILGNSTLISSLYDQLGIEPKNYTKRVIEKYAKSFRNHPANSETVQS